MCVSKSICTQNLPLILNILRCPIDYGIKNNIIVSLGDIQNRFPNCLNESMSEMFRLLNDNEVEVRSQSLMVVTHLVLNDMLKLKGEIVDVCMLIDDKDQSIR